VPETIWARYLFFRGSVFLVIKKVAADGCPFVAWIMFLIFGIYDEE
jgi:hypothetical protein